MFRLQLPLKLRLRVVAVTALWLTALGALTFVYGLARHRQIQFGDLAVVMWIEIGLIGAVAALVRTWHVVARHFRREDGDELVLKQAVGIAVFRAENWHERAKTLLVWTCVGALLDNIGARLWLVGRAVDGTNYQPSPTAFPAHWPLFGLAVIVLALGYVAIRWTWESHKINVLERRSVEYWSGGAWDVV